MPVTYYEINVSNNNPLNICVYRSNEANTHHYKIAIMLRTELDQAIEMVASFGNAILIDNLNVVYPQTHYFF